MLDTGSSRTLAGRKDVCLSCLFFLSSSSPVLDLEVTMGSFDLYLTFCTIRIKLFDLLVCSALYFGDCRSGCANSVGRLLCICLVMSTWEQ